MNESNKNEIPILYYLLGVVFRRWKLIFLTSFIICVITIIYVLFLPPQYTSEALIVPSNYTQAPRGKFKIFAAQLGLSNDNISNLDRPEIFKIICKSRDVLEIVAGYQYKTSKDSIPRELAEIFMINKDSLDDDKVSYLVYKKLRTRVKVNVDMKTQVIILSCVTGDPFLSAELLNGLLKAVQNFNKRVKTAKVTLNKEFIEQRMVKTQEALMDAENKLKNFREKNRLITHSPDLQLELTRLVREQKIQEEVFLTLSREYELAKIQEIKEQPVIDILESPRPPKRKSGPERRKIVMMAGMVSFFMGIGFAFMKEFLKLESIKKWVLQIYHLK